MSILLRAPRATLSLRDNARNCGICRTSTHLPDEERRGGLVCGWVSVSSRPTVPLFFRRFKWQGGKQGREIPQNVGQGAFHLHKIMSSSPPKSCGVSCAGNGLLEKLSQIKGKHFN